MNKLDFIVDSKEAFNEDRTVLHRVDSDAISYCYHVNNAIEKAIKGESNLTEEMLMPGHGSRPKLQGMSGFRFRHLMNNIGTLKGANYLEVGVWKGSTLISTACGNEASLGAIHAIDNFSEFDEKGIVEKSFKENLKTFLDNPDDNINFHKIDSFKIDTTKLPKFDIFFYDGQHSEESQYLAFEYYKNNFADTCIVIVDDWEQKTVRAGTRRGLESIDHKVVSSWTIIPGRRPDNVNRVNNPVADWWSGVFIAVIAK